MPDQELDEAEAVIDGLAEEAWHVCVRCDDGIIIHLGQANRSGTKLFLYWHVTAARQIVSGYVESLDYNRKSRDFEKRIYVMPGDTVHFDIDINITYDEQ